MSVVLSGSLKYWNYFLVPCNDMTAFLHFAFGELVDELVGHLPRILSTSIPAFLLMSVAKQLQQLY